MLGLSRLTFLSEAAGELHETWISERARTPRNRWGFLVFHIGYPPARPSQRIITRKAPYGRFSGPCHVVTGSATVILAAGAGKKAAQAIDVFLRAKAPLPVAAAARG